MTVTEETSSKKFVGAMWKLIISKAIILIIVGLVLLIFPTATLTTLIFIMGLYWLIDGIVSTYNALKIRKINPNWKWEISIGLLSIIAGIVVLLKPFSSTILTTSFLMWFLGLVAIINGVSGLVAGIRIQKQHTGEKSMIWGGVFSIVLGIILISSPFTSALVIIKIIGAFALFAGLITMALAFRIKKKAENQIGN
jgi:uncharacterized membrane protein HdeD (DUF308 family)